MILLINFRSTKAFKFSEMDNVEMNNQELSSLISSAIDTRMALVISLDGIVGNASLVLRVQAEFVGLKDQFLSALAAPQGEGAAPVPAPVFPPPVPVMTPTELRLTKEMMLVRKENHALAKNNKRDVLRKKERDKMKLPLHKKLYNSYIAVKHLLEDVKEEALVGAPSSDWERLGDIESGVWAPDQCSFTLHNIM